MLADEVIFVLVGERLKQGDVLMSFFGEIENLENLRRM